MTIVPDDSVLAAAHLMNRCGIGGLVVTEDEQIVGVITERDVLRRVVMTDPVVTCRPESKLEECSATMTEKRIRHLPVADEHGLVGIITSGDILAYQVDDQEATIRHLNSYIFSLRERLRRRRCAADGTRLGPTTPRPPSARRAAGRSREGLTRCHRPTASER
ncbi:MAG: CBS domain-containing protein [Gemmatimonadota bacterium]|nr:MAG: CBS domain-containing protein [Gemmatimonadota bacterium]